MLAAATAAENGAGVLLFEQNDKLGKKLRITGKGRCNITNDCSIDDIIINTPNGGKFLNSALHTFSPADTRSLFEKIGVKLKIERGNRVFPVSDSATEVVDALVKYMKETHVNFKRSRVTGIEKTGNGIFKVFASNISYKCKAVILATGGLSYQSTGSTGDGYAFASSLGHTITNLRGSLVPLGAEPETCSRMQGLTLKNIRLSVYDGGFKPIYEDFGELLFTHFGISGPLTLSASAHMRDFGSKSYHVLIDMKPSLDEATLDKRIIRDFQKYNKRELRNALGDLLPRLSIPVYIERSEIPPETRVHSITREQRMQLLTVIKSFRIDITGPRPVEEAIITSGGVDLLEISPKTMESKLCSGLYFAGEIIDADAYTGGFNLQISWSTAVTAAYSATAYAGEIT